MIAYFLHLADREPELFGVLALSTLAALTVATVAASIQWRKVRNLDRELAFKESMIGRGMTVEQVDRLIALGRPRGEIRQVAGGGWSPQRRLYRNLDERKIAGVCAGVGDYFGVDPTAVRIAYVVAAIATGLFPFLVAYVALTFIVPATRFSRAA